jgi:putative heme-binding domain-containing protein
MKYRLPASLLLLCLSASIATAVPEGFKIQEYAAPPNVDYPAAITVAANGDVYVSSDQNGSLGKDPHMGRVIRATDTNSDGVADEFQHFIPDVDSPRGGEWVGNTFYLIHPPYLSSFRDTDGDGVADEEKLLIQGLGGGIEHPRGADHTTNGVTMGIDGWLYIAVGDFGMTDARAADGSRYTLHGGGVVRVRPDGSELEPYALMVRNIYNLGISPYMDIFSRDNTNDGKGWNTRLHHFTSLGDHGYPRMYKNFSDEAIAPLKDYGGGSGTGGAFIHEPGFPGNFGNMLYTTDWTTGHVYYHDVKRDQESFSPAQEIFEVLPRATGVDVDGFSRLYLADWREGGFKYGGPDLKVGMVHVATAPGEKPASYKDVTKASDSALLKLLVSPSGVQRIEAQQEILKRGSALADGVLKAATNKSNPDYARIAAIFTYKQLLGEKSTPELVALTKDTTVKEFALRALTDRKGELANVPENVFVDALTDKNPRVVLQALVGLERMGASNSAKDILNASTSWSEASVSPRLKLTAVAALVSLENVSDCLAALADKDTRQLALQALKRMYRVEAVKGLIDVVKTTNDSDLHLDALLALARLHFKEKPWDMESWWGTRPDDRGPYFEYIGWYLSKSIRAVLEEQFSRVPENLQGTYLEGLAKNRIPVSELKLEGLDPVLAALGLQSPEDADLRLLVDAAKDSNRNWNQRLECYRALMRNDENMQSALRIEVLASWMDQSTPPPGTEQYVNDFVNEVQRGLELKLLRKIASEGTDTESRIAWRALLTMMSSPLAKDKWTQDVQKMVKQNPREIGFFLALADLKLTGFDKQIEVGLNSDNDDLIHAAQQAQHEVATSISVGKKVFEMPVQEVFQAAMTGRGDPGYGKQMFTRVGCVACHATDMNAEQKGPYLGSAGSKFTRDYLIDSVLDPNKVVAQGFQTSLFTLKDGSAMMGFVTAEADGIITVRDIAGQASQLKRANIAKEDHLPNSLMPPGLAGSLSVEEFTSLIDYLSSLKSEK